MPTQTQIADHLDMSQQAVAELLARLGIDWTAAGLDAIRVAYIRHLRGQAAGHKSEDGLDLVRERVLTERVDRELKLLTVAEKKGLLVNVEQLEPELMNMVGAFKAELLARDDKLKTELDALYGIDLDVTILNEHTRAALEQLGRYDPGCASPAAPAGGGADAAGTADHDRVGA
ncbi:MAG TPA: hypothetical protein PLN96_05195 [Zoogloea sp.]|uniref:hypothetical protein n=1 Tax=Zoogloea sp. TaxID=49181 RepID=UPI002C24CA1F|nr:hypothetical protein [Zoogloea sp.]HNA67265.1 hypothetical protein [Rhodocyclaceae bacterium]HNI47233.1 hypothetical protein [Zoogloea sp.]